MDQATEKILSALNAAAAMVSDGHIVWCTPEAQKLGIRENMPLAALLPPDVPSPDAVSQFSLPAAMGRLWAQVVPMEEDCLLIIREELSSEETAMLMQTSRVMRQPLNEILHTSRSLFEQLEEGEDSAVLRRTARLNRAFYQLVRTANALSDTQESAVYLPRRIELCAWLRGLTAAAGSALAAAGRILSAELPANLIYAELDPQLMEQALWCLLSNAVRYSPEGSTIRLRLSQSRERFLLSLSNPTAAEAGSGLGLGTRRVRRILRLHGGAMLHERSAGGDFCVTLSVPLRQPKDGLRAPILTDRIGGYNAMLVELSDVLPDEVYDSRNL